MGLLNFDDPDSAGMMGIAQGLLSASGPSRMPVSLGQALGAAAQQGQDAYGSAQKLRMLQQQMEMQKQQMAMQQIQMQMAQQKFDAMKGIYGQMGDMFKPETSTQVTGLNLDLSPKNNVDFQGEGIDKTVMDMATKLATDKSNGVQLTPSQEQFLNEVRGRISPVTQQVTSVPNLAGKLRVMGTQVMPLDAELGKGLIEAGKSFDAQAIQPGYTRDPLTGAYSYRGDPSKGLTVVDGKITRMPGAENIAGLAGETSQAQEQAKGYNPIERGKMMHEQGIDPLSLLTGTAQPKLQAASPSGLPVTSSGLTSGSAKLPPAIQNKIAEDEALKANANGAEYEKGLTDKVEAGYELYRRTEEQRKLIQQFKTGATGPVRAKLAAWANDLGASPDLVNRIAKGDFTAAQEFEKFAAQTNLEQLKQAIGANRMLKTEFDAFQEANPSLKTDPRAIERVFDWLKDTYYNDYTKQQALADYKKQGGRVADFPAYWAQQRFSGVADQMKNLFVNGYTSKDAARKDAIEAYMKNPKALDEINARLKAMGVDPIGSK